MKIRKADKEEWQDVAEIELKSKYKWSQNKEKTYEMIKRVFEEKFCEIYILEEKEKIGYFAISFEKNKKICYLNYFAIKSSFQGKGYSKLMLKKAIEIAKNRKYKTIELAVWAKNFPAIGLYNKFGFHVTEITKKKYSNGDDKLYMVKELK